MNNVCRDYFSTNPPGQICRTCPDRERCGQDGFLPEDKETEELVAVIANTLRLQAQRVGANRYELT